MTIKEFVNKLDEIIVEPVEIGETISLVATSEGFELSTTILKSKPSMELLFVPVKWSVEELKMKLTNALYNLELAL